MVQGFETFDFTGRGISTTLKPWLTSNPSATNYLRSSSTIKATAFRTGHVYRDSYLPTVGCTALRFQTTTTDYGKFEKQPKPPRVTQYARYAPTAAAPDTFSTASSAYGRFNHNRVQPLRPWTTGSVARPQCQQPSGHSLGFDLAHGLTVRPDLSCGRLSEHVAAFSTGFSFRP